MNQGILFHFIKKSIFLSIALYVLFAISSSKCYAQNIFINFVAVNPSETQEKETSVKYYLPRELDPKDIVNAGPLSLDYDIDQSRYFLKGTVTLKPKESKKIKVEVRDVWRIPQEEIDIIRGQIEENIRQLEGTEYFESAQMIGEKMMNKLDYVLSQQQGYSEDINRRIEEYRAYLADIDQIRKNAFSFEYFTSERIREVTQESVNFIIEVKNPSQKETRMITQKHYLPKEIRSEHILDSQGFDVRWDEDRQQSYLLKEEEFQPGETRKYTIRMKDIWSISLDKVDSMAERTERALEEIKGSEYEAGAQFIGNKIFSLLNAIRESQETKANMRKYIGAFRINRHRFEEISLEIEKIELMLARVKAKKLEELEKSKVKNILQKLKALRGIASLSEAIFGKKPTLTHTWRIIWGILIFVAVITIVHFFTWWKKARVMGEEIAISTGGTIEEIKPAENPEGEGKEES